LREVWLEGRARISGNAFLGLEAEVRQDEASQTGFEQAGIKPALAPSCGEAGLGNFRLGAWPVCVVWILNTTLHQQDSEPGG
jgi:hypothetical protein